MDKLDMQSKNLVDDNIEKIAKLFPNCITEGKNEDGQVVRLVDFDFLKQELSKEIVEGTDERYILNWAGKKQAILTANSPINATLRPCREESVDFDNTKNLYIEGDNLDVLKLLRETYLGKVKMIYIDPPYNTGHDFVYEDDFATSAEDYLQASKSYDEQGNKLFQNNDSNGRFHSDWLSMMYTRLKIAKDLLTIDGIMFISIGEHEIDNLKKLCIEIFGENNYIETYIWESTFRPDNSSKIMRRNAEYVICVSKNLENITELIGEIKDKEGLPSLTKASMKESILEFPANKVITYLPNGKYEKGLRDSYELLDDVFVENGIITNRFKLKGRMIWGQNYLDNELSKGTEIIIKGNGFVPYTKKAGDSIMSPCKIIPNTMVGDILSANAEMSQLFKDRVFSYPKPVTLLKYLINYLPDKNFIVMDFFSGSSTTAHAVLEANAKDGGNRQFIMVQLQEDLDENLKKADRSNILENAIALCDELGVPHILTEVAKERIRRAGAKIKEELKAFANPNAKDCDSKLTTGGVDGSVDSVKIEYRNGEEVVEEYKNISNPKDVYKFRPEKLDVGFRVLKLDSSCMKDVYYSPNEVSQNLLERLEDNIKEDRTPEDLLFQVMLDMGVMLSSEIKTLNIQGKKVFNVNDGNLVCCFDKNVSEEVVTEIAKMQPLYAVFRDASMSSDSVAVNFDQIFETYSPTTTRKVL